MNRFLALLIFGLLWVTGCQTPNYNARVFHPWLLDDVKDAKNHWDNYSNIVMVCIVGDHWEDRGPHRYSLHHYTGTVVKTFKGDWRTSEKITFVEGLDFPALMETNKIAGDLCFVFINQHTNTEIALETGDFLRYDAELEPALNYIYPQSIK